MSDATAAEPSTSGPPVLFLLLAALCVVVGLVLLSAGTMVAHVGGYVASSILTIVLVGVFRRVDLGRRLSAGYQARPGLSRAITPLLVVAFVVAAVHVWSIATELAS